MYFALWSSVKMLLLMTFVEGEGESFASIIHQIKADEFMGRHPWMWAVYIFGIMLILVLIDLAIRFSLYKAAKKDSLGIKKGKGYILLALLLLLMSLLSIIAYILGMRNGQEEIGSGIVSTIVELANFYTIAELIRSSFKLGSLRRLVEG